MTNLINIIKSFKEALVYTLTVAELLASISLAVDGRITLAIICAVCFVVSVTYAILTTHKRLGIKHNASTLLIIDGKPLDLLLLADSFRTQMDSVRVMKASHRARIMKNNDLSVVWNYSGRCIAKDGIDLFVFSIQGGGDIPLEKIDCYGFDLINDPERNTKIYATQIPSENGLSPDYKVKKIAVPFLQHIRQYANFSIELHFTWPNCMLSGEDYYISSLSFTNDSLDDYSVTLEFEDTNPKWVRVYSSSGDLLKQVAYSHRNGRFYIYKDFIQNSSAHSIRIYKFYRDHN